MELQGERERESGAADIAGHFNTHDCLTGILNFAYCSLLCVTKAYGFLDHLQLSQEMNKSTGDMSKSKTADSTFLYPSDIIKPAKIQDIDYSTTALCCNGRASLTTKVSISPLQSSATEQLTMQITATQDDKENKDTDQRGGGSPVLKSRRLRRKSRELGLLENSGKKHRKVEPEHCEKSADKKSPTDSDPHIFKVNQETCKNSADDVKFERADVRVDNDSCESSLPECSAAKASSQVVSPCSPSKAVDCISNIDFSAIFADEFTPPHENLDVSQNKECNDGLNNVKKLNTNDTFDSMFSFTDDELLASVCEEFEKPQMRSISSSTEPNHNEPCRDYSVPDVTRKDLSTCAESKDNGREQMFGFQTASRKRIEISKSSLQKAESLLNFDCLGDPL